MANINLDQLSEKIGKSLEDTARAFKISLFSGVIKDTRVDTGRLRGNWQTTTGQPANSTIERIDKSGVESQKEVQQNVKPFTTDYLTNNLPYAQVWEEKDGMIRKNIERIERNIKEEIEK